MNRMKFTGLITMMLLSIIGIIWVQIVWIRNAVNIRNESFNYAASVSLSDASHAIESSRRMNLFNNLMLSDPLSLTSANDISGFLSIGTYSSAPGNNLSVSITNQTIKGRAHDQQITTVNKSYILKDSNSILPDSITLVLTSKDESGKLKVVKTEELENASNMTDFIREKEFFDWLNKRQGEFQNVPDQMILEIYQTEKLLELDIKEINAALKQSLTFSQIFTPYQFALIKNGIVQDSTLKKSQKNDFLKSKYMVRLFPDNVLNQNLILSVIFPERTNYVLGSMSFILGGSMIFSLFILVTFALSLYFIIRQKKISEMKSDFINNMTHEFKTPIATISLAADTITNPKVIKDEERIKHFIGMIKKENSRMNKKVETILQIASLDKKEIEFLFENVSLHVIIQRAVDTIDIHVQQRNGKIALHLDAAEPVVYGDIEHLTNLVSNFLDNAIKYSPDSPDISVSTKNSDKGIILAIEDKGIGMTKAVQSKIFERFYRQSSGNVHDVKGFGLGLNYARAIIDAHKGNITVISEPGKGSRFEIFIPFNSEN
jgi:two-component system phosphate regulon sensor histidine kinase PhoR